MFLTFHSNPPTAIPPAAPVPAKPINKPLPTLLDIREAPIWKHTEQTGNTFDQLNACKVRKCFRLQCLYYSVVVHYVDGLNCPCCDYHAWCLMTRLQPKKNLCNPVWKS